MTTVLMLLSSVFVPQHGVKPCSASFFPGLSAAIRSCGTCMDMECAIMTICVCVYDMCMVCASQGRACCLLFKKLWYGFQSFTVLSRVILQRVSSLVFAGSSI